MPRQNGTYNYGMGYSPAATETTPVKQPAVRENFGQPSPNDEDLRHKAK
jgi:hypothetical protein